MLLVCYKILIVACATAHTYLIFIFLHCHLTGLTISVKLKVFDRAIV